jgi:hypothetical protein
MFITYHYKTLVVVCLLLCNFFLSGLHLEEQFNVFDNSDIHKELQQRIADLPPELQSLIVSYLAKTNEKAFIPLHPLILTDPSQTLDIPTEATKTDNTRYAQLMGRTILSAGTGDSLCLWDVDDKQCHSIIKREEKLVPIQSFPIDLKHVVVAPKNNSLCATMRGDKDITLWDLKNKKLLKVLSHEGDVWWAQFTSKGDRLVVGTATCLIIWDVSDILQCKKIPLLSTEGALNGDDTKIALKMHSRKSGHMIEVWDFATLVTSQKGNDQAPLAVFKDITHNKENSPFYKPFFDSSDALVIVCLSLKRGGTNFTNPGYCTVKKGDIETGEMEIVLRQEVEQAPRYAAYSTRHNFLLITGPTLKPQLWDLTTKKCLAVIADAEIRGITSATINTDQSGIAIGGFKLDADNKLIPFIKLWQIPEVPPHRIMQDLTVEKVLFFFLLDFLRNENKGKSLKFIQYTDELKKELQRVFKTLNAEEKEYVRLVYFRGHPGLSSK